MPDVPQLPSIDDFASGFAEDIAELDLGGHEGAPPVEAAATESVPEPEDHVEASPTPEDPSAPAPEEEKTHWSVKEVTRAREKRREAVSKYEELEKRYEALRQQQFAQPVAPVAPQDPADDFDSFLKGLGIEEDTDDGYDEQPRVNPKLAKMIHAQQKQLDQQNAFLQQQANAQMQTQLKSHVATIREDHPMVSERVLLTAIAQGLDPIEMALSVREAFEAAGYRKETTNTTPAPLSTPPKGAGAKRAVPQSKKATKPSWSAGRGKVPDLHEMIMEDLKANPLDGF